MTKVTQATTRESLALEEHNKAGPILEAEDLRRYFYTYRRNGIFPKRSTVKAVDGVSFQLSLGEILGLVGESGCGKTTTGKILAGLIKPNSGTVKFKGIDLLSLSPREAKAYRAKLQIVFQDPLSALNPRMRIGDIVAEPLVVHGVGTPRQRKERAKELLAQVGLSPDILNRYPHELSGGQRQRVCISRALALEPELLIADEPVSALDVSIRAQVLNLLLELHDRFSLSMILISHDISVVRAVCDRVAVMYLGKIVEMGETEEVLANPLHPYTQALLKSVPYPDPENPPHKQGIVAGEVLFSQASGAGCKFSNRCPFRMQRCSAEEPSLAVVSEGHFCACHLYSEVREDG